MSDTVITVDSLSKSYKIGLRERQGRTFRETATDALLSPFRRLRSIAAGGNGASTAEDTFWALKDVSFEVKRGEVVGIIGRNGAGKSTLLKILSRITEPTSGEVRLRGRVASLLEVGTGFHPELTGRENIYLNGAILGMKRAEIARKFDEIVAFAEVEKFLDTAVKRYSSGMYVRLAFAVAAHLEPEILIVDEVLSVGDAEFQKKCLGKMQEVSKGEGRTVLFVSHNMQAVNSLCNQAILLQSGAIAERGTVAEVTKTYLVRAFGANLMTRERIWEDTHTAPGNDSIRIQRVAIVTTDEVPNSPIEMTTAFRIVIDYWNLVQDAVLILNLYLCASDGTPLFETLTTESPNWSKSQTPQGLLRSTCFIPANLLNEGEFTIRVNFLNFSSGRLEKIYEFSEAASFSVEDTGQRNIPAYGRYSGIIHPRLVWQNEHIGMVR